MTCDSPEAETGAADACHASLTNASNHVDNSVSLDPERTKCCGSSGSMLSSAPSTITHLAADFITGEPEPGKLEAGEYCLAETDTPSTDPVALKRLKAQAQSQLKHAMLLKRKALKARLRQQQQQRQAEPQAPRPINALLKGGLACLVFTDINNSGPQEKVRFLTPPLSKVATWEDDSYLAGTNTTDPRGREVSDSGETLAWQKPMFDMQSTGNNIAADAAGSGEKQGNTREYLVQKRKDADRKRWVSTFNNFVSQQERLLCTEETKGKETEEQLRSCEAALETEERKLVYARGNSESLLTRKEVLDTLLAEQVAVLLAKRAELHDLENTTT